jgi:hypothetical protein
VDLEKKRGRIRLVGAPLGVIFLRHSVKKWTSLRARYNEAARMVRDNARLKRFWTTIVRQRVGLPPGASDN